MEFPDIVEVQVGSSGGSDSGHSLNKVRPLAYGIDNCHDGIISSGLWEFYNCKGTPTNTRPGADPILVGPNSTFPMVDPRLTQPP